MIKLVLNLYLILIGKMAESNSTDVLAAVATSLVLLFLVISIFIFIAGFLCGHYFSRRSSKETQCQPVPLYDTPQTSDHQVPVYEYVLHIPSAQEQDLELKENVAYGPSKSITVEQ